jgi:hypothetical protein
VTHFIICSEKRRNCDPIRYDLVADQMLVMIAWLEQYSE